MFERYTDRARQVVVLAGEEAKRLGQASIGTEHILLGLMREGEGVGAQVLRGTGVEFADIRQQIRQLMRGGQQSQPHG
jgi:ATP-dependent Clp protease ATP-binding subunit ClpC